MPRTRRRTRRPATPARTRPETHDPEAAEPRRRARRARRHRRAGARPGAGDPGLAGQAVPDPLGVDGADPRRRPAGPRQPLPLPLHRPHVGDIVVFHPPAGRRRRHRSAAPRTAPTRGLPEADRRRVRPELHQADRRRAGRHAQRPQRPPGRQRREKTDEPYISALRQRRRLQFAETDHDSARPLLHDGRQPWGKRRQPLLGTRPRETGSSARPSPPTGRRTASASSKPPRRARRTGAGWRARGASSPSTARSAAACRRRRRGRARLPRRPAGRRRGPDRLRGALPRRPPRARRPARLEADDAEKREELYPGVLRAAERVSVVVRCARGIDDRGLHVTNIEALGDRAGAARPGRSATCLVDGFSLRDCAVPHRAVVDGDGTSAAIAAASVIAKVTRDRYMHGAAARPPRLGLRGARRLLDPRAPRGDRADRHLAAAPPLVPVGRLLAARAAPARSAPRMCSTSVARPPRSKVTPTASKRISA